MGGHLTAYIMLVITILLSPHFHHSEAYFITLKFAAPPLRYDLSVTVFKSCGDNSGCLVQFCIDYNNKAL